MAYKGSLFDDPVEDFRLKLGYNVVGLRFGLLDDTGLTRMTVEAVRLEFIEDESVVGLVRGETSIWPGGLTLLSSRLRFFFERSTRA